MHIFPCELRMKEALKVRRMGELESIFAMLSTTDRVIVQFMDTKNWMFGIRYQSPSVIHK